MQSEVAPRWKHARPGRVWSFPRDHRAHDGYRTEWWYFTGHLESAGPPRRHFAYQFTFFRVGLLPEAPAFESRWSTAGLIMGHAALIDIDGGTHRFGELLHRQTPFLGAFMARPDARIAWSRGPVGTDADWELKWNGEGFDLKASDALQGFAFSLQTQPLKPLVLHGPDGFSRKGSEDEAASHYYSFTRLATAGELRLDGKTIMVSGVSWMDQEFSSSHLAGVQVGWDWFSLQLDDGRDLMLYSMRTRDGRVDFARGTLVSVAGDALELDAADWSVEVRARWHSTATDTTYPSAWRITVPDHGIDVTARPVLADQENRSDLAGLFYWEGAVLLRHADGRTAGRGFIEMTGYGRDNRPPL